MVVTWTNNAQNAFLTDAMQVGLTPNQKISLRAAGVDHPLDLIEVRTSDDWKNIQDIARRHLLTAAGATAPLGIKSVVRMKVVSAAMNYYTLVGRPISPISVHYTNRLTRFAIQIKALKQKAKKDNRDPTRCTPTMSVMKWVKHFDEDMHEIFTQDDIPVPYSYVTWKTANVEHIGDLPPNECFSEPHQSI